MTKLQEAFCTVNPVDAAMQKLALLQHGNRPVESMITDFRLLIGEADLLTTLASDQIHLIKMFMACLNPQLKKKIIFGDIIPKTIEDWYAKATQYNLNFQLAQAMMALDNHTEKEHRTKLVQSEPKPERPQCHGYRGNDNDDQNSIHQSC